MEYHGFRSVREYESECARLGFTTRRVPFHHESGAACFALITAPPGHPTGTSIESWTLFDADETRQLLDGVINWPLTATAPTNPPPRPTHSPSRSPPPS